PVSTASAESVEEQVDLPRSRSIDLLQDRAQPIDLGVGFRELARVFFVAGEKLPDPGMHQLVLGQQLRSLRFEKNKAAAELIRPLRFRLSLLASRVEETMALPLVAQLALSDEVSFREARDLRAHPVDHAAESLRCPAVRVSFVNLLALLLERRASGMHVRTVITWLLEDAILAGHPAKVPK